ncbi:MAG: AmmeMemoRadiSam system radical SAM enzyme [Desulfobacterales bacterium]|jgi:pyruvate formate lyase activating enzyme|nr:AmmeMemoRadiSam system radical SAM enzyme [Desulfobacteraceae bacterium]MBT4364055.1 AmmeMemoRadiSam system radical SAM enzyme [Desulfobacteraceae bacterium]MBT7085861.1 AmmeMemoRadiSam system radical SAM enzyme [Desulfobacterales bacterium]MBT7697285.1 AmmeMemoRadiSam system radical SAM enzyme [Desulfobacterales bacterium]
MGKVSRRQFIYSGAALISSIAPFNIAGAFLNKKAEDSGVDDIRGTIFKGDAPGKLWKWSHEGYIYKKLDKKKVVCGICPNMCVMSPGDRSVCRSRVNIDGTLYSLAYGNPCAVHVDPIEKKPLYHFKPRSKVFSIATTGCNLRCLNCQNWQISQAKPHEVRFQELFPSEVIKKTENYLAESIAYTYSEATTYYEYMIDTARIAREKGIYNLWISNGYINRKPLLELSSFLDGANVNLKSFSEAIYRKLNGGSLEPVLKTFKILHDQGIHFEMTNLVVPGYVDNEDMLKRMCDWILENLGPDYPLHFSRFTPRYKLNRLPPTPLSTLVRFRRIAMAEGINYVYLGNVPIHEGNNTYCHNCRELLIERQGYNIPVNNIKNGKCSFCRTIIPGVWN